MPSTIWHPIFIEHRLSYHGIFSLNLQKGLPICPATAKTNHRFEIQQLSTWVSWLQETKSNWWIFLFTSWIVTIFTTGYRLMINMNSEFPVLQIVLPLTADSHPYLGRLMRVALGIAGHVFKSWRSQKLRMLCSCQKWCLWCCSLLPKSFVQRVLSRSRSTNTL